MSTDVTDPWQCQRLIDATIEHFGQVDVLVNNAGSGITGAFIDTPVEEMLKLYNVNVFGAMMVMQAALKAMERQEMGVVINVASTAGITPSPYMPIYNSTKAALIMLSESVNYEYEGKRIRVAAVCPHITETQFIEAKKSFGRFRNMIFPGKPATAEWVAEKIVRAALNPKPLIALGPLQFPARLTKLLCPPLYNRIMRYYRDKMQEANPPVEN
jgi:short-subunit dehydrogenase